MVDVLTLNYNDALTTIEFAKSVSEYPFVDRVLIVDNCSSDNSLTMLKSVETEKIEIIESLKNGGYGAGNNLGIRYLYEKYKPKYILLANPDVVVDECVIKAMVSFLECNQDYALVAPLMTNPKGEIQYNTAFKIPNIRQFLMSFEIFMSKKFKSFYYSDISGLPKPFFDVGAVAGSLFLMNTELMIKYGMFDENVFLYGEELMLGIKFKKANKKIALLTCEKYIHNHSVSISKSYKTFFSRNVLLNKSKLYLLSRYFNAGCIIVFFAKILMLVNLVEVSFIDFFRKIR